MATCEPGRIEHQRILLVTSDTKLIEQFRIMLPNLELSADTEIGGELPARWTLYDGLIVDNRENLSNMDPRSLSVPVLMLVRSLSSCNPEAAEHYFSLPTARLEIAARLHLLKRGSWKKPPSQEQAELVLNRKERSLNGPKGCCLRGTKATRLAEMFLRNLEVTFSHSDIGAILGCSGNDAPVRQAISRLRLFLSESTIPVKIVSLREKGYCAVSRFPYQKIRMRVSD